MGVLCNLQRNQEVGLSLHLTTSSIIKRILRIGLSLHTRHHPTHFYVPFDKQQVGSEYSRRKRTIARRFGMRKSVHQNQFFQTLALLLCSNIIAGDNDVGDVCIGEGVESLLDS
jgi:hypothetical protein